MPKTIIMSLGGSLIAPDGIDLKFLRAFKKLVLEYVKKGNRVILITGGGNTCRIYQRAAQALNPKISHRDLDWIGIASTKLNAELVSGMFGDVAHESIIHDPRKKATTTKKIIVTAGFEPGHSTDMDAILMAKAYGAKTVINLSNIDYVYDKDPRKFKDAKPFKQLSWKDFWKFFSPADYHPGMHAPFDPVAAKAAERAGVSVIVAKGSNIANLKKCLDGKAFIGTQIS